MASPTTPAQAFASRLLADAGVQALVGTRVWPVKPTIPQAPRGQPPASAPTLPYVVFYKTSGGDGVNLNGRRRLQCYGIRADCYAQTEDEADRIRQAVNAAVNGWIDPANGVKGCLPQDDADQDVTDDNAVFSGQTFSLWFVG